MNAKPMLLIVATTSTPLHAALIQAKYGRYLSPFYDRCEMLERRAVVVRIETVGDFAQLQDSIGLPLRLEGQVLTICED